MPRMVFNDARLAGKIEQVRAEQKLRRETAARKDSPVHAVSDDMLLSLRDQLNEANFIRVQSHPDYRAVALAIAENEIPVGDNPTMNHVLREVVRYVAAIWCVGLAAGPGGLTFSRFNALLETLQVGSRTFAWATFGYLRFIGYIEPAPASDDRRERRFQPTARLREGFRSRLAVCLRAIGPMDPAALAMGERLETDDEVFAQVALQISDGLVAGWLVNTVTQEQTLAVLTGRRSGLSMLWSLVLAAPPGEEWPTAEPYRISIADLARRSGVSRPHFTRMLRDGAAAGMLALDGAGTVRLRQLLRDHINTLMALNIISYRLAADYAQTALARASAAA